MAVGEFSFFSDFFESDFSPGLIIEIPEPASEFILLVISDFCKSSFKIIPNAFEDSRLYLLIILAFRESSKVDNPLT